MNATCLNCRKTFEAERTDAKFCSGSCKAEFFRTAGATGQHADLERFKSKHCEYCGNLFWFNAYGDRGGKRVPTYCKDSCRVAAHRAKAKSQAQRQRTADNEPNSWENTQRRSHQEPPRRKPDFTDFRDNLTPPNRWSEQVAKQWLGLLPNTPEKECTKVWRDLNKKYHPDQNRGKVWPYLVHVNAAYDYLKRRVWKRR